jgi:hypothetical protein
MGSDVVACVKPPLPQAGYDVVIGSGNNPAPWYSVGIVNEGIVCKVSKTAT